MKPGRRKSYRNLKRNLDEWFGTIRARYTDQMQCGRGCSLCCYGLFDVSLPDALEIAEVLANMDPVARARVLERAESIQKLIQREAPDLNPPYFLNGLSQGSIDRIVDNARNPPCPFLGPENECLIYEHRPMACRLEGIPMVDAQDGLFGDWCELNFSAGLSPEITEKVRLDYYGLQAIETGAAEEISEAQPEMTVFIASVIAEFESFWKEWVNDNRRRQESR